MHTKFDEEVVCNDQETVMANVNPSNKWLLGITPHGEGACKIIILLFNLPRFMFFFWLIFMATSYYNLTNTFLTIAISLLCIYM